MAKRRYPVGAEPLSGGGVSFRVWAPRRQKLDVLLGEDTFVALRPEPGGYFSGVAPDAGPGSLYKLRVDGGDAFPDPASRCQPDGPHGHSQVVDADAFSWTDAGWKGACLKGQVIYELHT